MEQTETPVVETANKYELMVIFLPDLGEEAVKKELAEIKKLLSNDGGDVFNEDIWGLKDLAYRIRKQDEGYYVVLNFSLPGGKVAEVEHLLNIHQTVLRYLITKTSFDYKIRTLKDYEAESEKLDKEEQKVKNEAAARKGIRKRPVEPQRQSRSQSRSESAAGGRAEAPKQEKAEAKKEGAASAPKAGEKAIEKVKASEETHDEIVPKAAAERSEAEAPSEEEAKPKTEETATAQQNAETEPSTAEPAPKKAVKKAEKEDLDDFDKRLKSIIDDPDISL